jgi:hypothetical protein
MGFTGASVRVWKGEVMSEVVITVELDEEPYQALLSASNEVGLPVSEFARALIVNYVEENYAQV